MTTVSTGTTMIRLHVAAGNAIWGAVGNVLPQPLASSLEEVLRHPAVLQADGFRLLGTRENAPLIARLFERWQAGQAGPVELATPLLAPTTAARQDPRVALSYMRTDRSGMPASLGGWHTMQPAEYPAYAFTCTDLPLERHPAWPAIAFISGLRPAPMREALGEILDPRWYIDLQHPNRIGRLQAYMGCSPRTVAEVLDHTGGSARHRRLQLLYGSVDFDLDPTLPGAFLQRTYRQHADDKRRWLAVVRTCARLVAYLRHTWLDSIRPPQQADPLFSAAEFFRDPKDFSGFRLHLRSFRS